ncbi:hypothetical protein [Marinomonas sp. BSi20584]|uniref:hypothetical protein n=1 Tax=Marinomonas sp. BSi20584 TaxID=1594462 RepID=UPI000C1E3C31|nr:hypothetical protein [Marinomonas sp. BSi20584]PJE54085.1 hypothetical protein TY87_17735 [Marinomonas sp. BSi20584]
MSRNNLNLRNIKNIDVVYTYFDSGIESSYCLSEKHKLICSDSSLTAVLKSDEPSEKDKTYDLRVMFKNETVFVAGKVISDSGDEHLATVSEHDDCYELICEDSQQKASVCLYFI